ncbi:hypothetical protein GGR92_005253 [Spirosoma lacussanchae]|uniref:PD-(D/E)XK nuclease-like domain-containing protein n=1 Tax=Spirosoma lacussanchae TaxID=1884249 RepID=UPI001108151F|nr:PD-(D/E)XK nuclease-like domain-containing protein [Spirosoma lacussanchae]
MTYTDHQYRTLPAYANSDLSELDRLLSGRPAFTASPEALAFGTAFHTLILEPETFAARHLIVPNMNTLAAMQSAVQADPVLSANLFKAQRETVRQWVCPLTGLPLKCKIDAAVPVIRGELLIDLKTTSCKTRAEFEESCYTYGYDRQAAFYLASNPRATFFELVGVQKQSPYNLFRLAFYKDDLFIKGGRAKMEKLLTMAHRMNFQPISWSRKEVVV